jgi:NADPH2:quinone reductase
MKSIILNQHGGPEVLTLIEREIPVPQAGEILIRMKFAGISRPDKLMRTGTYPWTKEILPFYPGLYGAGVVAALGEGVTGYSIGQQVYVEHPIACGCYAEYKTAPVRFVTPIPDHTDLRLASISTSSLIIWGMLTECFPAPQGKTLYIQGAAGSMGTAVVQIAPLLGIRVIASASTEEKCAYLRAIGGKNVFCYRTKDPKETVLALTNGKGADIIMDQSVGEAFLGQMDFLAPMGTILIYNNTKGFPTANVIQTMTDRFGDCPGIRAFSFHYFDDKPELLARKKQEMFRLLQEGKICPHVGAEFPLVQAQKAHELLDSGSFFGSIVLNCE